ncbi:MAG: hypothetical protein QOF51_2690, partial [Chloroflexota bacterium]|nr:hypothetical protein [Chloroflexota bacterium]
MAHDAFISYAHQDKPVADAVCARLEAKGIRCWIAPRDVLPGSEWSAAILDGISESRLLVLIYSASANESGQVRREVERAVSKGIALLPFRIEDVPLSKSLEYFMSTPHWLDALSEPLEHHIEQLAQTVTILLARIDAAADLAPPSRADPSMTMPQPMASVGDPVGARTMQAPPQASDVAPARRVPRGGGA